MLYLWYFANISLVITSILLCLLVRSSQQFYACLRFAPLFSSVPIIPHFAFAINLVLRLFTFYTSLPPDGKRAPTIIGRGSFPRSRTGCDIFNCIAALPASHIPQHFTAGKLSFNLMQPRGLRHSVLLLYGNRFVISILYRHSNCMSICYIANISLVFTSCFVFLFVLIISRFTDIINLA